MLNNCNTAFAHSPIWLPFKIERKILYSLETLSTRIHRNKQYQRNINSTNFTSLYAHFNNVSSMMLESELFVKKI